MPTQPFITPERHLTLWNILGFCEEFKRHHGRWPRVTDGDEQFQQAGMQGLSGAAIERVLRKSSNGLADDPEFQEVRSLAFANGGWDVSIQFIDPELCRRMAEAQLERLVDSISVRTERGVSTTGAADGRMYVSLPIETNWRTGQPASAPVSGDLLDYIGARGMVYGNNPASVPQEYYLEVVPNGRLYLKYNRIIGSRYVGTVTPERLEQLRERLVSEALRERSASSRAGVTATAVAPAQLTLSQELALLTVVDGRLQLPRQQLRHYDDISRLMGKAGGRYVTGRKQFVFDEGIDSADLLQRLVAGETVNFQQQYQFFATPEKEAVAATERLRGALGTLKGMRILDPSAGDGALAQVARSMGAEVLTIELWKVNAIKLRAKGFNVLERDFLTVTPDEIGKFDGVLANPPFTSNQDIAHVKHMLQFIRPGGALSVIMSTAWTDGRTKVHADFKNFLVSQNVTVTPIEAGAFRESGTTVPTVRLDFKDVNVPRVAQDFQYDPALEEVEQEEPFALTMQ